MSKSRVAILSDSSLLCAALGTALSQHFDTVLTDFENAQSLFDSDLSETVLALDATYPQKTAAELDELARRDILGQAVVLLRGKQDGSEFLDLVGQLGAILPNSCTINEIVLTARLVRQGLTILPTELVTSLSERAQRPSDDITKLDTLTERESSVLALICTGCGNKPIARKLDISDSTVRVHVRSILKKLGLQNRTQAALFAHRYIARLQGRAADEQLMSKQV